MNKITIYIVETDGTITEKQITDWNKYKHKIGHFKDKSDAIDFRSKTCLSFMQPIFIINPVKV